MVSSLTTLPVPSFPPCSLRAMHRALSGVAWGLNRVAVGPKGVKADMLHIDNLVRPFMRTRGQGLFPNV